jgi:hypothetical protein
VSSKVNILNQENEPTFVIHKSREVIDLMLDMMLGMYLMSPRCQITDAVHMLSNKQYRND